MGEAMRVLVCGGRDFETEDDQVRMWTELDLLLADVGGPDRMMVIQGGAFGADALAVEWCKRYSVPWSTFPADWSRHGNSAGPIRNRRMLVDGRPDLVIAFPGGRGTANMVDQATKAGVRVLDLRSPTVSGQEG